MKAPFFWLLLTLGLSACTSPSKRTETNILLFTSPEERSGIADQLLQNANHSWKYVKTSDVTYLQDDSLKKFSSIVIPFSAINTLNTMEIIAIKRYLEAGGGGMVTIKDTVLTRSGWPWLSAWNQWQAGREMRQDAANVKILEHPVTAEGLQKALSYAIADNRMPVYSKVSTSNVPPESRYTYEILVQGMDEPMQMAILPNNNVLIVERKGAVKLYDVNTSETKTIHNLNVFSGIEDGLLGVAIDPNFNKNNWVYFYYAVAGERAVNRLSRISLEGDQLVDGSEEIILEIPTQRKYCCHSAGYLQFGPDSLLYLSTGDNTNAEETEGYIPIDERPGRQLADDQATAANTNDLRGKILRIKPEPDGTYSIPEGNLFPPGTPATRPEIYVMGNRNPYRFSIDMKNGFLYWGDVGPDTKVISPGGTLSYDEINQAREPGFYGWPYFLGDNEAFPDYDFATKEPGPKFDPLRPVNNSVNNTGLKDLPPAQPAMIWYADAPSKEFPLVGRGGQSAMAGPVYYADLFPDAPYKLPAYYDGKLFIYDWIRRWIMAVTFDENKNYLRMEPFLDHLQFTAPTDMQFAPDGSIYILEYGTNWFAKNTDARLVRITYTEGNRKPVARIATEALYGAAPFKAKLSASNSIDFDDGDSLNFEWHINDTKISSENITYTFDDPGVYPVLLHVTDNHGNTGTSAVNIKVGNAPPVVNILTNVNQSFYWDHTKLNYSIKVSDHEDDPIDPGRVNVRFHFLQQREDVAVALSNDGNTGNKQFLRGATLLENQDCKSCHSVDQASAGPSYTDIAKRYAGNKDAVSYLGGKIISGGSGVWGERVMSPHPYLSTEEAKEIVNYILAINNKNQSLPLAGSLSLWQHPGKGNDGSYLLVAEYTDKGTNGIEPLSAQSHIALRHPLMQVEDYDGGNISLRTVTTEFLTYARISNGHLLKFDALDLTDVGAIKYRIQKQGVGGKIEVRIDRIDGPVIGTLQVPAGRSANIKDWIELQSPIKPTRGKHDLFFLFINQKARQPLFNLDWVYFSHKDRS
jgi:cytochrome c